MIQLLASRYSKRIALGLFLTIYWNLLYAAFEARRTGNLECTTYFSTGLNGNFNLKVLQRAVNEINGNECFFPAIDSSLFYKEQIMEYPFSQDNYVRDDGELEFSTGPSQPEMQSFQSVNSTNLVDPFSGDFSYNIPLMDVGGYPINISYRSGISMDQEASWVGLGWNINPGTVTRNMRGLPDDFSGENDHVTKVSNIRENKTIGVTAGAGAELTGLPLNLEGSVGANLGIFNNNYKGWGLETGLNASLNAGVKGMGTLTGGMSITNNSQEGLTLSPSLSVSLQQKDAETNGGIGGSFSTSLPYNSRTGLKGLQLSAGVRQYVSDTKNQKGSNSDYSSSISFATPSYTPSITLPLTSSQFSFTGKVGLEKKFFVKSLTFSGYVSKQKIEHSDTLASRPAYGYLNFQNSVNNSNALLDFNREKEIPYREKPAVAHIAVPSYTYDVFSITGEGTGGMFRAYRGDVGFVFDHQMKTKDGSERASIDLGLGDLVHAGVDLNVNRSYTQSGPWLNENLARNSMQFKTSSGTFESVYFKNPGEKAISSKAFYDAIGGDDVVTVGLFQNGKSSASILATNTLNRYRNKQFVGSNQLTAKTLMKGERDKRSQVVSYLTAKEASEAGFSKYIETYKLNHFELLNCSDGVPGDPTGSGTGLDVEYFNNKDLRGDPASTGTGVMINYTTNTSTSVRWTGRIKAPVTGSYTFFAKTDDGVRVWLNDELFINDWRNRPPQTSQFSVNLVAGQFYRFKMEFYNGPQNGEASLRWSHPSGAGVPAVTEQPVPLISLYPKDVRDYFPSDVDSSIVREKRVNEFRKENHISEISVLNNDGKRYLYGIPVYNLKQKEATFSVRPNTGDAKSGLVSYVPGVDNSTKNTNGKDWYYSSELIPAYAHSFLLTTIISPDYVDVTGNGITDDDLGDAIKFNYTKVAGVANPFTWRAPSGLNTATYNEGLKTDSRDDKGNYVFGAKELWYWHSLESKSMVATFVLEGRNDIWTLDENGGKLTKNLAKRLKEINLYSKADLLKNGTSAIPIKTVHFDYSYELCRGVNGDTTTGKLTLKKIWFTYNGNKKGARNPYVFSYHQNNPNHNIKSYDKWGNFKDPSQNPANAGKTLTNAEYPYALKDSAIAAYNAGAWHLSNIQLPSGGRMKVEYESDDYAFVQNRRALEMFKVVGLGASSDYSEATNNLVGPTKKLFTSVDNLYVFVEVGSDVYNKSDVYRKYLNGVGKLYFKMFVDMPADKWGAGGEYISCYAELESNSSYGVSNKNLIWFKIKGITNTGEPGGEISPLAKAASQFLRLNLPSKAYPGSEVGNNMDFKDAVAIVLSQVNNIRNAFSSFDDYCRRKEWANSFEVGRSFVRLASPDLKKYGGGIRVKRITTYDNWNKMTGQREASYGQEYDYTTIRQVGEKKIRISSGVASYEPMIGSEENPFREPIEYVESVASLGPVTMGYTEEPLGESFFPSASVGYSKVRIRTIHPDKPSANGYEEKEFYTAYDFPTFTDRSIIDNDTKKRFKPSLDNFLKINAKHFLAVSQGFKVELNDMHGKMKSQATYSEISPDYPLSYTHHYYKISEQDKDFKTLENKVMAIDPTGKIDTSALIGKDVELMVDFREQHSISNGNNFNVNGDFFTFALPPVFLLPSFLGLAQREENRFRSVATTKVINRFGILDSVVVIEKGSRVRTKNLLHDSETGEVVLTETQNEFNDPIFNFNYPSHWAYDQMGMAYKNIGATAHNLSIKNGKIIQGLTPGLDTVLFSSGDELLVGSKVQTGGTECSGIYATFPNSSKAWVIDANIHTVGAAKKLFIVDEGGNSFSGNDVSLKVIRSGRRNISASVGAVTCLVNPLVKEGSNYKIKIDGNKRVLNASSTEYKHFWQGPEYCSGCPNNKCYVDTAYTVIHNNLDSVCWAPRRYWENSIYGTWIYSSFPAITTYNSGFTRSLLDTNSFWISTRDSTSDPLRIGPLNRSGIWNCIPPNGTNYLPPNQWIGFTDTFSVATSDTVFVGAGADNGIRIFIDGTLFRQDNQLDSVDNFRGWHVLPKYLTAGTHSIKVDGINKLSYAGFGVEIYANTEQQIRDARSYEDLDLRFSTRDVVNRRFPATINYTCPEGYSLDSSNNELKCRRVVASIINPYKISVAGNWRPYRSYLYYGNRSESSAHVETNVRRDGSYTDFSAFWKSQDGRLVAQYDSTKWVWNSEMTLFNRKGFELENKDPLGRYNSGLYGYNATLPTAVVQNSKYQQVGFDGFEDYHFQGNQCDTICGSKKHLDFNATSKISDEASHSGKFSIKLGAGEEVSVSAVLQNGLESNEPALLFTQGITCGATSLSAIRSSNGVVPVFTPIKGTKILVSAWVKESSDCKCETYVNNEIIVGISKRFDVQQSIRSLKPKGSIIEGWQRYEDTITLSNDAKSISITLKSLAGNVYFDDVRIHPFNANMKSFVYDPISLRLMAELDENNYATFYEYDDDGTLIRVKKETERGIKTIKETRSALKNN